MIPIKAVARLEFATALAPWLDLRSLLRAAQGAETEIQGQPIRLDRAAEKQRVTLQVRAVSVEGEAQGEAATFLAPALRTLDELNAAVPFPEVTSYRLEMIFIDPYELPFHALVGAMRAALLAPNQITDAATDLQVVIDEQIDEQITRHTQLGPMLPEQILKQFLAFPNDGLPAQFIFAGMATTIARATAFKPEDISAAASEFAGWADQRTAEISALLRG